MSEKKLYDLVSNANKRIARINEDFIPVTVKSVLIFDCVFVCIKDKFPPCKC